MEMELPPVERPAKQDKIMSLQSIAIRRMHLDDRGLPLQLEEAVTKEEAKQAAREEAKLRLKTGEEEEEVEGGGEQRRAPPSPLAQLSVHVVEAVRPHTFQPFLLQEEHFLYANESTFFMPTCQSQRSCGLEQARAPPLARCSRMFLSSQ